MLIVRGGYRLTTERIAFGVWPAEWQGYANLTNREYGILALLACGLNIRVISGRLGISRQTVHSTLERAKEKLGVTTNDEALSVIMGAEMIGAEALAELFARDRAS